MVTPGRPCGPLRQVLAWLSLTLLLAGCAQPTPRGDVAQAAFWSGRLALTILGEPRQSFSAGFELRGDPSQGELQLFNPLGGTLAVLSWTPQSATLQQGGKAMASGSLEELVVQATGAQIPVATLFDWLKNRPTEIAGWRCDLSRLAQGRLQVQRSDPAPEMDLRLQLDR